MAVPYNSAHSPACTIHSKKMLRTVSHCVLFAAGVTCILPAILNYFS